jgi:phosphohistidine phosphatase
MRHAKSGWDNPELSDHDRPLNPRGLRDAPRMAACLIRHGRVPDSITSSTAIRAEHTARLVAEACRIQAPVRTTAALYHADTDA